jgi:hypothetical protein
MAFSEAHTLLGRYLGMHRLWLGLTLALHRWRKSAVHWKIISALISGIGPYRKFQRLFINL